MSRKETRDISYAIEMADFPVIYQVKVKEWPILAIVTGNFDEFVAECSGYDGDPDAQCFFNYLEGIESAGSVQRYTRYLAN